MKISSAAILFNNKIYTGISHCEIGCKMVRDKVCERYPSGDAQGFITDDGKFVSRWQALRIAIRAGQVEMGKTVNKNELFSEDLKG